MAQSTSSFLSKDGSPCSNYYQHNNKNCDSTLDNQLSTLRKFDEKQLQLCGFIDELPLEALKFFWNVILRKGSAVNYTSEQLYKCIKNADHKMQKIIKNPKDVKEFLHKYPNLFFIDGEKISLNNQVLLIEDRFRWIKRLLQNEYPDVNKTVINAIHFYSDILYDKEDDFPIDQLVTHRNKARQDVQIIAINPLDLKSFLIAYPQVFIVKDDTVSLTYSAICDISDYTWLGEMCNIKLRNLELRVLGKAVTYYLLILYKKKSVHQLPLSKLFAFRNVASADIKELTKTLSDLKKLFVKYISVFQISKDNVMIKDPLLINLKRDEVRMRDKKGRELSNKDIVFIIQENIIKTAMDVCLRTIRNTLESKRSLEVPLEQLFSEFEYMFENVNDLKMFLSHCLNEFIVNDNVVILKNKFKSICKPAHLEQVKDFCINFLLQNVGADVRFPLIHFKQLISLAPSELQPILRNETDFRSVIRLYPDFRITDDYILLKRNHKNQAINSLKNIANETLMFFVWVLREKVGVDTEFPIVRLKIYLDLAPSEVLVQDILQLKALFQKHSSIFNVNNNNVILKNVADQNLSFNPKYEKLCYIESYSTAEAIAFYANVLKRFCFNLEVPVEHLFGYRSLAPVEVFALAKSSYELKKFLSSHPDIFTVQENNVCLTKTYGCRESIVEVYDEQEVLAIEFYSSILNRVSPTNEFPIVRLFGYQYLASPEVKESIKTPLDLKEFLNKYPKIFYINNDIVLLKKRFARNKDLDSTDNSRPSGSFMKEVETKDLDFTNNSRPSGSSMKEVETTLGGLNLCTQPINETKPPFVKQKNISLVSKMNERYISRKSSIIRSIRFYSNIMFKKGPNSEHQISNLLCFRNEATNEIKEVAKKPIELLTFLSKFPQIFTVNSGKYTVMLTDMVTFYKNERYWIKELLPKYHQSTTNHETVVSGIQFYVNIIFERGLEILPIKSLFRYRKTAMSDVQTLANSATELNDFLAMYPEIFKISDEGVSLTAVAVSHKIEPKWIEEIISDNPYFNESSKVSPHANELLRKKNSSSNLSANQKNDLKLTDAHSLKKINFLKSVLETVGKGKEMAYTELFEFLNAAPEEFRELFKTQSELKDFLMKYSNEFTVKNDRVGLVCSKSNSKAKKRKQQHTGKGMDFSNSHVMFGDNNSPITNPEICSKISKQVVLDHHLAQVPGTNTNHFDVIGAILFYFNIMWQKGPHLEHNVGNLFSHNSKASIEVKKTVKSAKELKDFLSKYPQLFSVNHEKKTATLSDLQAFYKNQRSWIKEFLPEHHQSTTNHEIVVSTIYFYSNILFEKSKKCELPLSVLFSYRNTAMQDVQMMVKNVKELHTFLSLFSDIFIVDNDKVSLSDCVISQLKKPKWIVEIVNGHESSIKTVMNSTSVDEELLKKKKIAKRRAVQFYYKIMLSKVSNSGLPLSQLFDYLPEAPSDVQEVVKSVNELRDFFSKYPHIFIITNDMVFLTTFNDK